MDNEEKLAQLIDGYNKNTSNKVVETVSKENLKYKTATVVGYDEDTYLATVYFGNQSDVLFTFYNKTGTTLSGGDNVKIQYTVNPAKGDLTIKCGRPEIDKSVESIAPITAIFIQSDTEYHISTNSGVEKYVAIFDE